MTADYHIMRSWNVAINLYRPRELEYFNFMRETNQAEIDRCTSFLKENGYGTFKRGEWNLVPSYKCVKQLLANHVTLIDRVYDSIKSTTDFDVPEKTPSRVERLAELIGIDIIQGLCIMSCLEKTSKTAGDVCEFGVAQGATSALIANEIRCSDKTLWLFDSFEGLPKPTEKDTLINDIFNLGSMSAYEGKMASPADMVMRRMTDIQFPPAKLRIVPGFVETTLTGKHIPDKVSFAFIDLDLYEPIKIALEFLHRRLQKDGIMIVHDYGHFSSGAKTAVDEFISANSQTYRARTETSAGAICIIEKTREASEFVQGLEE